MPRPNILWICTDQQRFDTLGCYDNEFVETPNIDRLAESGTRFDRAYCQSPVCTPSRASFLTGRYPRTTRARQNGQAIPDNENLISRRLADEGYICGLSGKHHTAPADPQHFDQVRHREKRIDDGYTLFHWSHNPKRPLPGNEYTEWLQEKGVEFQTTPYEGSNYVFTSMAPEHHYTTWCTNKAINFIESNKGVTDLSGFDGSNPDEPWLFSVNIFDPHEPFDPPKQYLERYLDRLDEIPLPNYERGERNNKPLFQEDPPGASDEDGYPFHEMEDEDHQLIRAAYWAMIDLVDKQVGRLLNALEETDQMKDTLVIFMSDHGEMLGDHGLYLKGPYFYEPAIRVPLIMSWPGHVQEEQESEALIELTDIVPTLLDAIGLERHSGIQGDSFWPLLSDQDNSHHRDDIYCEYYHALERPKFYSDYQEHEADSDFHRNLEESDIKPEFHNEFFQNKDRILPYATMIRTDRYKLVYVHSLETGELYDLNKDPTETNNLYGRSEYESIQLELFRRLTDRMAQTIDPLPQRVGRW